ncbi:MAG: choice-of-anchor D domain-containing protein [Deltaproteobacteria bacterium]|nr:choice-of-anchor D domain-containing protein [Deltaproteobacteria bacterium]
MPIELMANDPAARVGIGEAYSNLSLYFIQNDGQIDEQVVYYEKGGGHATYFTKEGVYLSLVRKETSLTKKETPSPQMGDGKRGRGTQVPLGSGESVIVESIKLSFIGANKNPDIIALDQQEGKVNHFIGNDTAKWRTNMPTYSSVLYKNIYDGIDIRFYGQPTPTRAVWLGYPAGSPKTLEYDIIVKPGADPNIVRFVYEGIEGLKVADTGDMEISLKQGKIIQKKPYVYQEIDGERKEVDGNFAVESLTDDASRARFSYSFALASYDRTIPLIIDPALVYSTYLGGSGNDYGEDIAVDASGSAYVTGYTGSADFPTMNPIDASLGGNYDGFVAKINPAGSALVYSTYLGGSDVGSGYDAGYGIAVDIAGNAYVTGHTYSVDFPTMGPIDISYNGSYDAFVTMIGEYNVPYIFISPSSYDFGGVILASSSPAVQFVISNTGHGNLLISSLALGGANASEFAITSDNCTSAKIARNQNCFIGVAFIPNAYGPKSASLDISSNDTNKVVFSIPLSGTGGR